MHWNCPWSICLKRFERLPIPFNLELFFVVLLGFSQVSFCEKQRFWFWLQAPREQTPPLSSNCQHVAVAISDRITEACHQNCPSFPTVKYRCSMCIFLRTFPNWGADDQFVAPPIIIDIFHTKSSSSSSHRLIIDRSNTAIDVSF